MLLPDHLIHRRIKDGTLGIEPFDPLRLQPASYDVTMSHLIRVPALKPTIATADLDVADIPAGHTELQDIEPHGIVLGRDDFILACTREVVTVPPDLCVTVEGRSSLGRLGLAVHITAGYVDPGFTGQITLEIKNSGPWRLRLRAGMDIGQLVFQQMADAPARLYGHAGNRYQGQEGPVESRYRMKEEAP